MKTWRAVSLFNHGPSTGLRNTNAVFKKGQSRLPLLRGLRTFNPCRIMLHMMYYSMEASVGFRAAVCSDRGGVSSWCQQTLTHQEGWFFSWSLTRDSGGCVWGEYAQETSQHQAQFLSSCSWLPGKIQGTRGKRLITRTPQEMLPPCG